MGFNFDVEDALVNKENYTNQHRLKCCHLTVHFCNG